MDICSHLMMGQHNNRNMSCSMGCNVVLERLGHLKDSGLIGLIEETTINTLISSNNLHSCYMSIA